MKRPSPEQMGRARRLLTHEGAAGSAAERATTPAIRVYAKLRVQLVPLLGEGGFHLLFVRSAKLAQGDFAFLAEVSILDGSTKLRECLQAQDPAVSTESAAALFGTFFTLVTTFIGERLTTQLLRNGWPTFEETAPREDNK